MTDYKLVPTGPTPEWVATLRKVRIGRMESVIEDVLAAAPAVQGEPDRARLRERFDEIEREIMENKHTASSVFTQMRTAVLYTAPQPAVQQPCPEGVREGAPYDDPTFESLCREHEIWGTPAAAQCAVFWEAGKRAAAQLPAPDVAGLVEHQLPSSYPVSGNVFFRESTGEWALEITASINGAEITARHTQPADTRPEDVAGLPALYESTSDITKLVEALECARNDLSDWITSFPEAAHTHTTIVIARIDAALATHRKQGGGK